jgi:hypothetical protein
MKLVGARTDARVTGVSQLPGRVNYLLGRDPSQWHTDIATYRKVRYSAVFPGVDLVFYGHQGTLEYDFVVAPGTDPSQIVLEFSGAKQLKVEKSGDLSASLRAGSVCLRRPTAYQELAGGRRPVSSRFVLGPHKRVTVAVGSYNRHAPLIIDPVFLFSTYAPIESGHGFGTPAANGIAIDRCGNVYVAGTTVPYVERGVTAQVSKLDPTGSTLLYTRFIGGGSINEFGQNSGQTRGTAIAVDSSGNAYVVGTDSTALIPRIGGFEDWTYSNSGIGPVGAFLVKINPSGDGILYSTYIGGSTGNNYGNAITVGVGGKAYICGGTTATDFPLVGALQKTNAGSEDAFVAAIDTEKTGQASLSYSTLLGGSDYDSATSVAIDRSGRCYVAGSTRSPNFPTKSAYQASLSGTQDAFVAELSADGATLTYSSYLGGSGRDDADGIAVDGNRNVFVAGYTDSADFPLRNALQSTGAGAFVTRVDCSMSGDSSLAYSTHLSTYPGATGPIIDVASGIGVDLWGNVIVAGTADRAVPDPSKATTTFVVKVSTTGRRLLFAAEIGGSDGTSVDALIVDFAGNAYVTGYDHAFGLVDTRGPGSFPITARAYRKTPQLSGNDTEWTPFLFKMPTYFRLDLDGDTQPDFLFQNQTTGELAYWLMDGDQATAIDYLFPSNPGAPWRVAGMADLNGDNSTDLVFQNSKTGDLAYWLMDGTMATSIGYITPKNPGTDWNLVGMADFNRDGYTDILFQNSVTGNLYVWLMQGTREVEGQFITPKDPGADWKVVAVGDMNNDGHADILFQNINTGNLYVWYMVDTVQADGQFLSPNNPGAGWNVVGLSDINADGQPEIVFQEASTGMLAYWVMDGASLVSIGFPDPMDPGGPDWKLVGPK